MKSDFLNVPIEFCNYCIKKKIFNQARVFLYLKFNSSGKVKYSRELINEISKDLNINLRTAKNHLRWLQEKKWIGVNSELNILTIKSFKYFAYKYKYISALGALSYQDDINAFRAFAVSASMTQTAEYIKRNRKRREMNEGPGLTNGESYARSSTSRELSVPIKYYAKILNLPRTTVRNYKHIGSKKKYLKFKKRFGKTKIRSNQIASVKKYGFCHYDEKVEFNVYKLRYKGKAYLREQLPDAMKSNIILRRKRNLKEICSKNRKI
jgi:hypothetical protein